MSKLGYFSASLAGSPPALLRYFVADFYTLISFLIVFCFGVKYSIIYSLQQPNIFIFNNLSFQDSAIFLIYTVVIKVFGKGVDFFTDEDKKHYFVVDGAGGWRAAL